MQETVLVLSHKSSIHWARKIWHAGMGSIGLAIYATNHLSTKQWGLILVAFALICMVWEVIRLKSNKVNALFCQIAQPILRTTEQNAPTGIAYYALGVGLSALFFEPHVALLAACYLIYADPIASIVGVKYGKTKFWNNRSFEGSLAFFNVAITLNLIFFALGYFTDVQQLVLFSFLCAACAALSEVVSIGKHLDDNLVVPLASGLFITLWNFLLIA